MAQRILIVEDEDKLRRVLSLHLQGEGFETDEARTAEEALPLADRAGLVLTDLRLPTVDGLTLMERLRLTAPATPVVVMTAYGGGDGGGGDEAGGGGFSAEAVFAGSPDDRGAEGAGGEDAAGGEPSG
jgi:CheY-like chemotaxis protein